MEHNPIRCFTPRLQPRGTVAWSRAGEFLSGGCVALTAFCSRGKGGVVGSVEVRHLYPAALVRDRRGFNRNPVFYYTLIAKTPNVLAELNCAVLGCQRWSLRGAALQTHAGP